ncbi:MAG: peptide-methionine (R)-S-oxide reductase MsrB [Nitrosomonas sp.]|nr:peptide-methionine (R)-S-oxide reductase MsrB [Nitrosomonas sp.]
MKRRIFLKTAAVLIAMPVVPACFRQPDFEAQPIMDTVTVTPLDKPHQQWRALLSPEAYRVLFEENTEAPGSSVLNDEYRDGVYLCAACYLPLFESEFKYSSGTGWPSFTQPISGHIATKRDYKLILPRTEYHCARCGGHQGHVFDDGPPPRGQRWCNNGLALKFVPAEATLPELRG